MDSPKDLPLASASVEIPEPLRDAIDRIFRELVVIGSVQWQDGPSALLSLGNVLEDVFELFRRDWGFPTGRRVVVLN